MDPETAFGLAASVVNFLDYVWQFGAGTLQSYRSPTGEILENVHFGTVINDLRCATYLLDNDMPTAPPHQPHQFQLQKLAHKCSALAEKLISAVEQAQHIPPGHAAANRMRFLVPEMGALGFRGRVRQYRSEILLGVGLMLG